MSFKKRRHISYFFYAFYYILLDLTLQGCSIKAPDTSLPLSEALGQPRNYQIARVITHFHSPISYDACDQKGIINGALNSECLNQLKQALCKNHIDYLFLADHPDHMSNYEIKDLLLPGPNDKILLQEDQTPYANQTDCGDGFTSTILVGFEANNVMALGMRKHLSSSISERSDLYHSDSPDLTARLKSEAHAMVVIPHTESKAISEIENLHPDAIEIYNFHANVDPKIRATSLNLPPFSSLANMLTYLVDPFHELVPDFGFMGFLELSPIYFQKWNTLIDEGYPVVGLGGTDSHQNIFPQLASDGERLDSHRRISRIFSNHILVKDKTPDEIQSAITQGQGWIVFEGLGSPSGMDFYATVDQQTIGVGQGGTLPQQGSAKIVVSAPSLLPQSPQGPEKCKIRINLKKVLSNGSDQIVATSTDSSDLVYFTDTPGAYRAEVMITPLHLKKFLGDFADDSKKEFYWIITNHIYLSSPQASSSTQKQAQKKVSV